MSQSNFSVQVQKNQDLLAEMASRAQSQNGLKRIEGGSFDNSMHKHRKGQAIS
jgi:hypothetical protein